MRVTLATGFTFIVALSASAAARAEPSDDATLEHALAKRNEEVRAEAARTAQASEAAARARVEENRAQRAQLGEDDTREKQAADAEERRIVRRSLGFWMMPVGAAVAAGGIAIYASALSDRSAVEDGSLRSGADIDRTLDGVRRDAVIAVTVAAVGAALTLGGLYVFVDGGRPAAKEQSNRARIDLRRGALTW